MKSGEQIFENVVDLERGRLVEVSAIVATGFWMI